VTGEGIRPIAALAIAILAALLLVSCGGGGDSTQAEAGATAGAAESRPSESRGEASEGAERSERKAPPHEKFAEEDIESFGEEASGSDETTIVGVFETYLGALAGKDAKTACEYLTANVQESLQRLAGAKGKKLSCARILPKLLSSTAPAEARQQANGEIKKVRVKGDTAFVVFHAPGAKLFMLTLVREGGRWKATTVAASVLVPEL
jgi:hypothetical protein